MRRLLLALSFGLVLLAVPTVAPAAQSLPYCPPGVMPLYVFGFAALHDALGDRMGDPLECEHTEVATGDAHQQTEKGLSFYRKSTNTPTFTNGWEHWALTAEGLIYWTGTSIDPPFQSIAGHWGAHGTSMYIGPGGEAEAAWRVYTWCDSIVVRGCDSVVGNNIIPGGHATLRFTHMEGEVAVGTVLATTDPGFLRTGPVLLIPGPYGTAELEQEGVSTGRTLCGPSFHIEAPQSFINTYPCGA